MMMNGGDEIKQLDPQLWHACAGGMVQMPPLNSRVFYFPQGHIDHSHVSLDPSSSFPNLPPLLPCILSHISYLADPDSDEVFAKIKLLPIPLPPADFQFSDDPAAASAAEPILEAPASFAKTLTQSDANNGGGFSVPRYCAETIFPPLDYSAEPPVQTILAKDVHGVTWKFRHIYRGTPRRHLLTTGWSNFVNHKKLLAGDSIVFLRADSGDLCVGIRRAKKGIGAGPESPGGAYSSSFLNLRDDDDSRIRAGFGRSWNGGGLSLGPTGKVAVESVIEAAQLAASGRPFEVVYYPRSSTPEFCVRASAVRAALQVHWCSGMRFKMAFETEDSSRISWFMGTISAVQVADPVHWPNSPWRLLQVEWDEPELLQNVKRVNPWLVEMVASMPSIHHMSPFTPPRKKLRLPQPEHLPFIDGLPVPSPSSNNILKPSSTFCCVSDNSSVTIPAGIQGARHALFGHPPSFAGFGKLHSGLFPAFLRHPDIHRPAFTGHSFVTSKPNKAKNDHDLSCLLTMGSHYHNSSKKRDDSSVAPKFMLFGKPILTAEQISQTTSGDDSLSNSTPSKRVQKSSDPTVSSTDDHRAGDDQQSKTELGLLQAGHCKLFLETEDVAGRTSLDKKLANMFGVDRAPEMMLNNVNHKPFSEFLKTARTLTILADAGGENLAR